MSHRLPVRVKLLAGFTIVLALMAVLTFVSITKMDAIKHGAVVANDDVLPSTKIIAEIDKDLTNLRSHQWQHLASTHRAELPAIEKDLASDRAEIADGFRAYERFFSSAQDRSVHAATRAAIDGYLTKSEPFLALSRHGDKKAGERALDAATPAFDAVGKALDQWNAHNAHDAGRAYADARSTAASAKRLTIMLLIVGLAAGLAVALLLSRAIARGVAQIVQALGGLRDHCASELGKGLQAMAGGDLTYAVEPATQRIERWSNDEIGDVAQATNAIRDRMVESIEAYNASRAELSALVGHLSTAAASVSAGSRQMAATSEEAGRAVGEIAHAISDVATGAQRQVTTVDTVRRAVEQVSSVSEQSARNAQDTAHAAEKARSIAVDGSASVQQATEAMSLVRAASQQATEAIRGLGAKSDQIGGIVGTIGGIAEQTNLLALNAAIEAARAGEQGRGFAVVAEEVRKLAEESQQAAASIAALIGEIQDETGKAIEVVEAGARRTADGAATVEQAREAFTAIGASVEDVTARVSEIAAAIQQVAASATSVRDDMTDVSAVAEQSSASTEQVSASAQETAASTQEISASAGELARTAGELDKLVQGFKVAA
jgi:methyl-accepting chemotaxis protein